MTVIELTVLLYRAGNFELCVNSAVVVKRPDGKSMFTFEDKSWI